MICKLIDQFQNLVVGESYVVERVMKIANQTYYGVHTSNGKLEFIPAKNFR